MTSSSELQLQVIQENLPENFSIPFDQVLKIASLFQKLSKEQHIFQMKRAIVLLARSLAENQDVYSPSISAMKATFEALLKDLGMDVPEKQDEFLNLWLLILRNACIRVQSGQLSIDALMEAIGSIGNAYRN